MNDARALAALRGRPGLLAVQVMRSWAAMKVRERGQNRGRWVDAIVATGGGTPSDAPAWCAYACWAAWHSACWSLGMELAVPTSGSVARSWLLQHDSPAQIHIDDVRRGRIELEPGDMFIRTRNEADTQRVWDGHRVLGHAELVIGVRDGVWLHTVGGNTSAGDSREGDGVFEKPRGIRIDDPRLVGFVRPAARVLLTSG